MQILRQLLQRRLRRRSQDAGYVPQLLHPRDRGVPEDGPAGWYAAVLCAPQVLAHVAHLLRPRLEHHQEGSTEDGGGRVRLPLGARQADDVEDDRRASMRSLRDEVEVIAKACRESGNRRARPGESVQKPSEFCDPVRLASRETECGGAPETDRARGG